MTKPRLGYRPGRVGTDRLYRGADLVPAAARPGRRAVAAVRCHARGGAPGGARHRPRRDASARS